MTISATSRVADTSPRQLGLRLGVMDSPAAPQRRRRLRRRSQSSRLEATPHQSAPAPPAAGRRPSSHMPPPRRNFGLPPQRPALLRRRRLQIVQSVPRIEHSCFCTLRGCGLSCSLESGQCAALHNCISEAIPALKAHRQLFTSPLKDSYERPEPRAGSAQRRRRQRRRSGRRATSGSSWARHRRRCRRPIRRQRLQRSRHASSGSGWAPGLAVCSRCLRIGRLHCLLCRAQLLSEVARLPLCRLCRRLRCGQLIPRAAGLAVSQL